jgi:S1-C subfamily serine protease
VIIAMDSLAANEVEDSQTLIQQAQPGQDKPFALLRDGKQVEIPVTLGERPASTATP